MTVWRFAAGLMCLAGSLLGAAQTAEPLPLPEHPRPDLERKDWQNLNGPWGFRFDAQDLGLREEWFRPPVDFSGVIQVPFPWGSPLSGVADRAEIAWYHREIRIPESWRAKRVFLVVGAADWQTTAWLDGQRLGVHEGGYIPFEFELTRRVEPGRACQLVLRVDDRARDFKLEGKQGYGNARGIWQTVYLEARGAAPMRSLQFTPDIDRSVVKLRIRYLEPAPHELALRVDFRNQPRESIVLRVPPGRSHAELEIGLPNPHLWSLPDPFLYEVEITSAAENLEPDRVMSYFGMRKISVERLPSGEPWVALNGRPVYLQMTLDQAYHPTGFYAFPSDQFLRGEIQRSLQLGLNGMRVHVKTAIPRKLYWADRLGMLIMADVPNSWGEPTDEMRREVEKTLEAMIERDFNHPSVFSWVIFNETWGLRYKEGGYTADAQLWVRSMYDKAKALDATRLVEDNSANREDHVATDINSWHAYLPGYAWGEFLAELDAKVFSGSPWNFVEGEVQRDQPFFNSECGNVWGYQGSTGDVDWSWDYHLMINEFRRYPKLSGWLYTEHHDVINEWNGYYRFDRSEKEPGLGEIVPGMSIQDLHSDAYVVPGRKLCTEVEPGGRVEVPLWLSVHGLPSDTRDARLVARLSQTDDLGRRQDLWEHSRALQLRAWSWKSLDPVEFTLPDRRGLAVLGITLEDSLGAVLHRNFTTFLIGSEDSPRDELRDVDGAAVRLLRFSPRDFSDSQWPEGKTDLVLDGLKVAGTGSGFFEYRIDVPADLDWSSVEEVFFLAEMSSRRALGRDAPEDSGLQGDYMRGRGSHDPGLNPNAYPMTDSVRTPSLVRISVQGVTVASRLLADDPADHRGILSWHSQLRDRHLRDAGTFGYLVNVNLPEELIGQLRLAEPDVLTLRLEADSSYFGGLALYGERFGRYPVEPTLGFILTP